jgi:acetamidase/formamidase
MGKDILINRDKIHFVFDKNQPPVVRVGSGSVVMVETERADCMLLSEKKQVFRDRNEVLESNPNPVTGPIFIEGAEVGDYINVSILQVTPCPDGSLGYVTYVPGPSTLIPPFSLLSDFQPESIFVRIDNGEMVIPFKSKTRRIEIRPFIGTIGTAPSKERKLSYWNNREYCGNVDCSLICKGNQVLLPVNTTGALLSLGDVHIRQGDGEVSGCAVECRGDVLIRIDVVSREEAKYIEWPQVNGGDFIGSLGCVHNSMEKAIQASLYDLVRRVELYYNFSVLDAYQLVSQCVELKICQSVYPHYSCLAKIEKKYL